MVSGIALTIDARAADGPSVGMVTKVENQAQVGGVAAAVGSIVHMKDTLNTGAKARLQVTFRDQSNLSLARMQVSLLTVLSSIQTRASAKPR